MADITGTYSLNSNPAVRVAISYQMQRTGTSVGYRFALSVQPITGASWYGYDVRATLALNGATVASDVVLKGNSPSQWASPITVYLPSSTGWYTVSGVTSQSTLRASLSIRSKSGGNTGGSGERTVNVPGMVGPTAPTMRLSTTTCMIDDSVTVSVSGGSWGDGGPGAYHYQHLLSNGTWEDWYVSLDTSHWFIPAHWRYSAGQVATLRVVAVNGAGQTAATPSQQLQTILLPTAPVCSISDDLVLPTDTVTVSATGGSWGTAGSGTYAYQHNRTGSWATWATTTARTATIEPTTIGMTYGDSVQMRVVGTSSMGHAVTSNTVTLSCISDLRAPVQFRATPPVIPYHGSVTLSWAALSISGVSIVTYQIATRVYYHRERRWTDWYRLADPTGTSYTHTPRSMWPVLGPHDQVQYSLRAQVTGGLWTSYAYTTVYVQGTGVYTRVGGQPIECVASVRATARTLAVHDADILDGTNILVACGNRPLSATDSDLLMTSDGNYLTSIEEW